MPTGATNAALKEWAVVCQALATGRQTLLIRKGGILEVRQGFEVVHSAFWLFPTYLHQQPQDVVEEARAACAAAQAAAPAPGWLDIALYAEVADTIRVTDLERLRGIAAEHILSEACVASRFHYRNRPGVHVLVLRVFRCAQPVRLPQTPGYDGCVSWVELDQPLAAEGLVPVLSEAAFQARRQAVLDRLAWGAVTAPSPS